MGAQLVRGSAWGFLFRILEVLITLVVVVLLARVLGAYGYGIYAFVLALVSLAAVPVRMGVPPLVVRETARAQQLQNWDAVRGIWRWANGVVLILSLAIISGGGLVLWLGWVETELVRETLIWGLVLVPFLALVSVRSASLRGLRHVLAGVWPEQVLRPGLLAVFLLAVLLAPGAAITASDAMALTVVATLVSFVVGVWLLRRYRPRELRDVAPRFATRAWLGAAWPMALTQGFQQINRYADILLLGVLAAVVDVGVYRVAAQGALLVSLGLSALNMVVAPFITRLHAGQEVEKLQKLARRTSQAALAFAIPATLLFVFFGEWMLVTFFGSEFAPAYWPLLLLAFGQLISAWFGAAGMLLNMTGYERDVTRAVAVAAVGNIGLNLMLIPPYGVTGAAVATTASIVFWNIWMWRAVHRRLGIRCSAI